VFSVQCFVFCVLVSESRVEGLDHAHSDAQAPRGSPQVKEPPRVGSTLMWPRLQIRILRWGFGVGPCAQ